MKKKVTLKHLFTLTEIISPNSNRHKIKQAILADDIEWLSIVKLANTHFLTAALYYSLLQNNLLKYITDKELLDYLKNIYNINLKRNQKIVTQSVEISNILLLQNIRPVFLKGTASLLQNDYPDLGMRFLSDIDFLVQENVHNDATELLKEANYLSHANTSKNPDWHHSPPMYHEKWDMVIEIHRYVLPYKFLSIIPTEQSNQVKNEKYQNIFNLTPTYRLLHAYIHSEIVDGHYYTKTINLRQLYEIAILVQKYQYEIDWVELKMILTKEHNYKKFTHTLSLVIQLFHIEIEALKHTKVSTVHSKLRVLHFKHLDTVLSSTYLAYHRFIRASSKPAMQRRYGIVSRKKQIYFSIKHLFSVLKKILNI